MIQGLEQIQSPELRKDITSLYHELVNEASKIGFDFRSIQTNGRSSFSTIIYNYVLGINRPICICDGMAHYNPILNHYDVEVLVDYRVSHGYKPYQSLDKPLHIYFTISKQIIRNNKIIDILDGSIH